VGPRASLDAVVKRKIPSPHRESNPASSPALYRLSYRGSYGVHSDTVDRISELPVVGYNFLRHVHIINFSTFKRVCNIFMCSSSTISFGLGM
jgi:hypothetical protein